MHTNHTNAKLLKPVHADQIAKAKRITDRIRVARAAKPVIFNEDVIAEQVQPPTLSAAEQDRLQHEWI